MVYMQNTCSYIFTRYFKYMYMSLLGLTYDENK